MRWVGAVAMVTGAMVFVFSMGMGFRQVEIEELREEVRVERAAAMEAESRAAMAEEVEARRRAVKFEELPGLVADGTIVRCSDCGIDCRPRKEGVSGSVLFTCIKVGGEWKGLRR